METDRRFIFRGEAAAAGGRISRPKDLVIDAGGASALTVAGGRSRGELGRTRFGEFASFRSASTFAEGVFDDRQQLREVTHGRVREDTLTTTTVVRAQVREIAVGADPTLRVELLQAALTARSPQASGEPAIKTSDLRIAGVDIGGHALIVDLDPELFERYDTRAKLLTAVEKPAFVRQKGASLLMGGASGRRYLMQADGTIYASVVREIRWKGRAFPGATIEHHRVRVPGFGRIFFGEIFVTAGSRRLTMMRLELGSPVGGFMAFDEVGTNGSWYPP